MRVVVLNLRVCLINPPRIQPKTWGEPSVYQPMDLVYVAAVLEKKHKVCIIDAPTEGWRKLQEIGGTRIRQGLTNEEIAARIREWNPDMAVITVPFSGWSRAAFETAAIVKEVNKNIVTVLMGLHPSARPVECLAEANIDFVVIGEPEMTVLELADTLEAGDLAKLKDVKGIAFKKDGKTIKTPLRPVIEDLDCLPFPARDLLPMKEFFEAAAKRPISGNLKKPSIRMLTSRGCGHACIFCSNYIVMGRKWRARSAENVVQEIEQIVRDYGVKQIDFLDDNITLDRKRMMKICDLIIEKKLNVEWCTPNGVRADCLDKELLAKMKKAGCKRILVAPESGVQRVVDQVIQKKQDLKKVENAVELARKVGIEVGCFFILGMLGETKEDMMATIAFAHKLRKLGADRFYFSYATPLYGTELYEQAKRGGFLKQGLTDEDLAAVEPLIETSEFTAEDLRMLCAEANLVNPTLTRGRLIRAARDPKKAVKTLFARRRMTHQAKTNKL
jgi:anaerobic magnesium-protoporphyrin IX monomethyl ester cyclase